MDLCDLVAQGCRLELGLISTNVRAKVSRGFLPFPFFFLTKTAKTTYSVTEADPLDKLALEEADNV